MLLEYVATLHITLGNSVGTVKCKLAGIRYGHQRADLPDPTSAANAPGLARALKGMKRHAPPKRAKLPATKKVVTFFEERAVLNPSDLAMQEECALITLMYFFLMRVSETVPTVAHPGRALTEYDLAFRLNGRYIDLNSAQSPDEIVVFFKESKTDQDRMGCLRSHAAVASSVGSTEVCNCPVRAVWRFLQLKRRLEPQHSHRAPLFHRWSTDRLRKLLQTTMSAVEGVSAQSVGTHSLRIGGATALWRRAAA